MKDFIVPAIDVKEGQVVRLFKGDFEKMKSYDKNPEDLARLYQDLGFKKLHLVDLDGALRGNLVNLDTIERVRKNFGGILEVGGGVRSLESCKLLASIGVDLMVIGTVAIKNPNEFEKMIEEFPNRLVLSVDSKGGKVAVGGWKEHSSTSPQDLAKAFDDKNIWGYLYTDIDRDGTLEGVDVDKYREFKGIVKKPVLASGGVRTLEDIKALMCCVDGVVVGKAIYEGYIDIINLK